MSGTHTGNAGLPGEVGLWVFIFIDLLFFSLLFSLAAYDMGSEPELFREGKAGLLVTVGMLNTLVLLTGSWAVAMGTRVVSGSAAAAKFLYGAAFSGVIFLLLKIVEYSHAIGAGHTLSENPFYTWYFVLTAFHAFHVVAGIVLLGFVAGRFRHAAAPDGRLIEAAGCYWHLVDLLWIGIFLILYLL